MIKSEDTEIFPWNDYVATDTFQNLTFVCLQTRKSLCIIFLCNISDFEPFSVYLGPLKPIIMENCDENVCKYCHKTFKNVTIRKRHERIHTDEVSAFNSYYYNLSHFNLSSRRFNVKSVPNEWLNEVTGSNT